MNGLFTISLQPAAAIPPELHEQSGSRRAPLSSALESAWCRGIKPAILIILIWTSLGVFLSLPDMLKGFQWPYFIAKIIDAWAWALLTPALLLIDKKLAPKIQNVFGLAWAFLVLSVPFSLIHTCLAGLLLYSVPEVWWNPLISKEFSIYYFLGGWMTYCAAVGAFQSLRYYNRYMSGQLELKRVENNLLEWRLNALRLHLEPHFLFNTLNAISSEVDKNPKLARGMIGNLGALLRRSLECKDRSEIPLAQELALLDHYISIQRIRFGDRIEIRLDIEPETLSAMVPSMLLQPLVENAIRHGLEGRLSGGVIDIVARLAAGQLLIHVLDDGVGLAANWRAETCGGLGVRVTRERLAALYPDSGEQALTIQRRRGGGTEVTICLPLNDVAVEA